MKKIVPLLLLMLVTGFVHVDAQDRPYEELPELPGLPDLPDITPIPGTLVLPANISLYNYKVPLLPNGRGIFGAEEFRIFNRPFIPDMQAWQNEYYSNNFPKVFLTNPTLVNGNVMEIAMRLNDPAYEELYRNYVIMNQQQMVGNSQLERMTINRNNLRYIDVIGAGRVGNTYIRTGRVPRR